MAELQSSCFSGSVAVEGRMSTGVWNGHTVEMPQNALFCMAIAQH
jgi:hypothetical protein